MPIAVRNVIDHGFSVDDVKHQSLFFHFAIFVFVIGFWGDARIFCELAGRESGRRPRTGFRTCDLYGPEFSNDQD